MDENEEATNLAKLMYFSNQIIYKSKINESQMKVKNNFLEYLKYTVASEIEYDHNVGHGEFYVHQEKKLTGKAKS